MGLMNSPAKRAYSLILSVSMTTVMRYYQGGGGEVPVYSPITASVVLIIANVLPLTYHCQDSILHCVHTTAIEH